MNKKRKLYSAVCCTGEGPKCFLVKAENKKEAEKKLRAAWVRYYSASVLSFYDMYLDEEKFHISEVEFGKFETVQIDMGE